MHDNGFQYDEAAYRWIASMRRQAVNYSAGARDSERLWIEWCREQERREIAELEAQWQLPAREG